MATWEFYIERSHSLVETSIRLGKKHKTTQIKESHINHFGCTGFEAKKLDENILEKLKTYQDIFTKKKNGWSLLCFIEKTKDTRGSYERNTYDIKFK